MRLFTIGDDFTLELNQAWILLIPEFAALLRRDKGSTGDYRGEKKLKARKELAFIYFDLDFTSPIREWESFERRAEAMKYAGLVEADLDGPVMAAHKVYDDLLQQSSRSLKTLQSVEKGLNQLDSYFANINFTDKDKKGELLHDPKKYIENIKGLGVAYDALDKFRKRVEEELKGDASIRGQASLGRKEGKRESWSEEAAKPTAEGELKPTPIKQTSFAEIADMMKGINTVVTADDDEETQ